MRGLPEMARDAGNVMGLSTAPPPKKLCGSRALKEGIAEGEGLPWLARATFFARRVVEDVRCGDMALAGSAWSDVEAFCSKAEDDSLRPVMHGIVGTTESFLQELPDLKQQDLSRRLRVLQRELHGHCQALLQESEQGEEAEAAQQWHRAMRELTDALCDAAYRQANCGQSKLTPQHKPGRLSPRHSDLCQAESTPKQGEELLPSWCQVESSPKQGTTSCDQSIALWQTAVNYCVSLQHCFAVTDPKALSKPTKEAMAGFPPHLRDTAREIGTRISELWSTLNAAGPADSQDYFEATQAFVSTIAALLSRLVAQVEAADDRFELEGGRESLNAAVTGAVTSAEQLNEALSQLSDASPAQKPKSLKAKRETKDQGPRHQSSQAAQNGSSPSPKVQAKQKLQSALQNWRAGMFDPGSIEVAATPRTPSGAARQSTATAPSLRSRQPAKPGNITQPKGCGKCSSDGTCSLEGSKVAKTIACGSSSETLSSPGPKNKRGAPGTPLQAMRSCQSPRTPSAQPSNSASPVHRHAVKRSTSTPAALRESETPRSLFNRGAHVNVATVAGQTAPHTARAHVSDSSKPQPLQNQHPSSPRKRSTGCGADDRGVEGSSRTSNFRIPDWCMEVCGQTVRRPAVHKSSLDVPSPPKLEFLEQKFARAKQLTRAATEVFAVQRKLHNSESARNIEAEMRTENLSDAVERCRADVDSMVAKVVEMSCSDVVQRSLQNVDFMHQCSTEADVAACRPQVHQAGAGTPKTDGESALTILASHAVASSCCEERISLALLSLCRSQPNLVPCN